MHECELISYDKSYIIYRLLRIQKDTGAITHSSSIYVYDVGALLDGQRVGSGQSIAHHCHACRAQYICTCVAVWCLKSIYKDGAELDKQ